MECNHRFMDDASATSTAQRVLERLDYDFDHFELDHFVSYVEQIRARKIYPIPCDLTGELTGLWIPGESLPIDFVIYRADTHPMHQAHIILHELAHMLLEHPPRSLNQLVSPELLQQLNLGSQGHVRSLLNPDQYEREAEAFVRLIQQRVVRAKRLEELTTADSSIEALRPFVREVFIQDDHWQSRSQTE